MDATMHPVITPCSSNGYDTTLSQWGPGFDSLTGK